MRIPRVVVTLMVALLLTGTAFARHRSAPTLPGTEIEGLIKTATATELVVTTEHNGDVTVEITPDTIFRSNDVAIAPTDLNPGDRVEIKAVLSSNVLNALVVKRQVPEQEHPQFVELNGVIKSVTSSEIVVTDAQLNDTTVAIDSNTQIFRNGSMATAGDLVIGDRVEIKATMSGTTLTALVINAEAANENNLEISGMISALGTDSITVTTRQGDVMVTIDTNTQIFKDGQTATLADLAIGDRVEIKASVNGTTTTALFVNAETPETENEDVDVSGTVSAVGSDQITVTTRENGDVVVKVDANTSIRKDDQSIAIGDIHIGDQAEAKGTRVDAQTILASEIEVRSSSSGHH